MPLPVLAFTYAFNMTTKNQHGFIALISILILSSALLASTLALAQFGIASRFFILNLEQKASSQKLAEACLEMMRIKVYNQPSYSNLTAQTFSLAGSTCTVVSATSSGSVSSVRVSAQEGTASTNLWALIDNQTGSTTKLYERGTF